MVLRRSATVPMPVQGWACEIAGYGDRLADVIDVAQGTLGLAGPRRGQRFDCWLQGDRAPAVTPPKAGTVTRVVAYSHGDPAGRSAATREAQGHLASDGMLLLVGAGGKMSDVTGPRGVAPGVLSVSLPAAASTPPDVTGRGLACIVLAFAGHGWVGIDGSDIEAALARSSLALALIMEARPDEALDAMARRLAGRARDEVPETAVVTGLVTYGLLPEGWSLPDLASVGDTLGKTFPGAEKNAVLGAATLEGAQTATLVLLLGIANWTG